MTLKKCLRKTMNLENNETGIEKLIVEQNIELTIEELGLKRKMAKK